MTAAFLLMSSAALAGADVAPPAASAPAAPVVVSTGAGCTNCGTPAPTYSCGCSTGKVGLLDKLKSKFGKKSTDCGCSTVPSCAPVYVPPPATCNTCNSCPTTLSARPNLFDKFKSWNGHKKASSCGPVCDTCGAAHLSGGGCATPGAPYVPPTTGTTPPPKEMPKDPKEMPKDTKEKPKTGGTTGSAPIPLPPVSGAGGLTGSGSPY